jgi:ADP-ribose diphosphatase
MKTMPADRARVESSRHVFTGHVFIVDVDRVHLPHGVAVDMEVVRHPPSVVLIPVEADERIVLVRQYRYAVNRWLWELPAGSVDEGESLDTAASRECAEEIGRWPGSIEPLGSFYPSPGFCDEVMVFFRLTGLRLPKPDDPAVHQDPDEHLEIRSFALHEIQALIRTGDILDMKTIAGISLIA